MTIFISNDYEHASYYHPELQGLSRERVRGFLTRPGSEFLYHLINR